MKVFYSIRGLLATFLFFLHTGFFSLICFLAVLLFPSRRHYADQVVFFWAKGVIFICRLEVVIQGKEHLPRKGKGALYLFNHTSYLDIPILNFLLPHVRFGSKAELFNIPFFGYVLKKIGSLVIERKNPRKVVDLYKKSINRVLSGESFALAPEGTRQDGSEIKTFKRGPFLFALKGKIPLIPIVLFGSHISWPKGKIGICFGSKKKRIQIQILPPIETQFMSEKDLNDLKEKAYGQFSRTYKDLKSREL